MRLAGAHGLTSIAFPAISTGVYRFPLERATRIAVATVTEEAPQAGVGRVIFACFGPEATAIYRKVLAEGA